MNKKLLSQHGLKWNPFSPQVPVEALLVTPPVDSFCRRVELLASEGGFAQLTGVPGTGKSVTLRILADRLGRVIRIAVDIDDIEPCHLACGEHIRHISAVQQQIDTLLIKEFKRPQQVGDIVMRIRK